ncbi:MAG: hypothetical protein Ct9H300mP1_20520 [Planctomycetaceae bacterium]|nr:MAG: hypothetical protein Ct9H300mP1_20520 [Planctomycetaceae bacterium]
MVPALGTYKHKTVENKSWRWTMWVDNCHDRVSPVGVWAGTSLRSKKETGVVDALPMKKKGGLGSMWRERVMLTIKENGGRLCDG